ncbi:PAM68 family protein [Cyanobium sp. LEGE 06143]|uniref:PAM68 family protein n=1 Tax=Cyanobium sp. LEGE 06143 TaxID=945727 RepID=UPI001881F1F9|nr:PAM68 family protein [Cyanobium sp. LEGE 06143]MBE9173658.1 PAM68 family protein [Cyanobium sp. LEGE 06143]
MAGKGLGDGAAARASRKGSSSGRSKPSAVPSKKAAAVPSKKAPARAIPDVVANRMARRVAIATGIPTVMGMGVFVGSYLLVSRQIADVSPGLTLAASGGCFLLGLVGLSYGVLSASWEDQPGSLLGQEQLGLNIGRLRQSLRSLRSGS